MAPALAVAEQVGVLAAGLGVVAGAGLAATALRQRPRLARFAPAVEMAGAIAYDALAAASRRPGLPDYAAARATALREGEAALRSLAPGLPATQFAAIARAALGAKLAQDPSFSATPLPEPGPAAISPAAPPITAAVPTAAAYI